MRLSIIVFLFLLAAVTSNPAKSEGHLVQPSTSQQKVVHGSGVIHTPNSNNPSTKKSSNSNSAKNGNTQKQEDAILPAISSNSKPSPEKLGKPIKATNQKINKRSGADHKSLPPAGTLGKPKSVQGGKSGNSVSAKDEKRQKQLKPAQTTISSNLKPTTGKPRNPRGAKDTQEPKKPAQTTISPNSKPTTGNPRNPQGAKDKYTQEPKKPAQTNISPNLKPSAPTLKPPQTTILNPPLKVGMIPNNGARGRTACRVIVSAALLFVVYFPTVVNIHVLSL